MSDIEAFRLGDNGVGCWGDDTAQLKIPMCALPPEDMEIEFGSVDKAKHQKIKVVCGNTSVICLLADRMPHKCNIRNGCGIDLNPAALVAFGKSSTDDVILHVTWEPIKLTPVK